MCGVRAYNDEARHHHTCDSSFLVKLKQLCPTVFVDELIETDFVCGYCHMQVMGLDPVKTCQDSSCRKRDSLVRLQGPLYQTYQDRCNRAGVKQSLNEKNWVCQDCCNAIKLKRGKYAEKPRATPEPVSMSTPDGSPRAPSVQSDDGLGDSTSTTRSDKSEN